MTATATVASICAGLDDADEASATTQARGGGRQRRFSRAEAAPGAIGERIIRVRFNADVDSALPWEFETPLGTVALKVGEEKLVFYRATNRSDETITATALFNVTPFKVGPYFSKIDCFCFEEQVLRPGEIVEMGVSFYVDPDILEDRNLNDITTITLSYALFRATDDTEVSAVTIGTNGD